MMIDLISIQFSEGVFYNPSMALSRVMTKAGEKNKSFVRREIELISYKNFFQNKECFGITNSLLAFIEENFRAVGEVIDLFIFVNDCVFTFFKECSEDEFPFKKYIGNKKMMHIIPSTNNGLWWAKLGAVSERLYFFIWDGIEQDMSSIIENRITEKLNFEPEENFFVLSTLTMEIYDRYYYTQFFKTDEYKNHVGLNWASSVK
jgi:hypothetical protein